MRASKHMPCLLAGLLLAGAPTAVHAGEADCAALTTAAAGPDTRIAMAVQVAAGAVPENNPARGALTGAQRLKSAMPAHCLINGVVHPRTGVGGVAFGDRFELRLPDDWNGKLLFQGGGGMDGSVAQAVGALPIAGATAPPALLRGYAVVATDSGHEGKPDAPGGAGADATFALDQQARIDYFYKSIGDVTEVANTLISAHYGRKPSHSYFMGCSNGGRSAMIAAQRYPLLFDGIVAGAPAFRVSQAALGMVWMAMQFATTAPTGPDGKTILSQAFSDADLKLVSEAVLTACDGADGVRDGMISAPSQCRFDPDTLRCTGAKTETCLSDAQVVALTRGFAGPHNSAGQALYTPFPYDAGIASTNWRGWTLGTSPTGTPNARFTTLVASSLAYLFRTPPDPSYDAMRFDPDRDPPLLSASRALNDADSTMYASFLAHGGKAVIFQGYSDPVFSPLDLIAYYRQLAADNGGMEKVQDWAKVFFVPGMTHCGGGPSLDDFDPLTALEGWVEKNTAPSSMIAKGTAFPGRSRPLCPYPQEAIYNGTGNTEDAASFTCRPLP